jgi:5-methylcytosine-specific restriction endonuclease McrA
MAVFVLDKHQKPLMPCSEKRARLLLNRRKARVHTIAPFTIRLVHREKANSNLQPIRCKIDPGSKTTGLALVREEKDPQVVVSLAELTHRGSSIRDALHSRSAKRRRRRSLLRYRPKRFSNRKKPKKWLPPSLRHRLESTSTWIDRFRKRVPITSITCERVKFDTQKLLHPEIDGIEYQRGTLFGYEIREYLLEKWGRKCAYCHAENIPLQIDHIIAQSRGGSNRIDNLTLACSSCNQKKNNQPLEVFNPKKAKTIRSTSSLRDIAAVNATREALWDYLTKLPFPCEAGTGGQTKYNRTRLGLPKMHALDAACTGEVDHLHNWQIPIQQILSTGRGTYQRTRVDRFGFPRGFLLRQKQVNGFQTGDLVKVIVPSGKKQGFYVGRVAIRASGYFNIQTTDIVVQGISSKHCHLMQRANGYHYPQQSLDLLSKRNGIKTPQEERQFLPALKGWVSLPSIG